MEKRKAIRLVLIIAGATALVCAVAIVGFRQNSAASAGRSRSITPVLASYGRPQGSAAARIVPASVAVSVKAVSARVGTVADDPLRGIPSHKRYAIVGEGPLDSEDVHVPMGVSRAESQ